MRHAILVLAHGDLSILKYQMTILDDPRFDFYIHIDKKTRNDGSELLCICHKSRVFITEQIPVYWGHSSINEATMILIHKVLNSGLIYDYAHLLSGVDLPIKLPDQIDQFYNINQGKEFVVIWKKANWRTKYRYPFVKLYRRTESEMLNKVKKFMVSRIVRFPRKRMTSLKRDMGWDTYCGEQWWSYTWEFLKYIGNVGDMLLPYFKDCYITDECFTQTILMNSNKFCNHHSNQKTREILWENYSPHIWERSEVGKLLEAEGFFARKFSLEKMDVVEEIFQSLKDKSRKEKEELV